MSPVPWPVIGSVLPVIGGLYLIGYLLGHKGKPGVNWFIITLVAVVCWCFSYGTSLLVFDPTLRLVLEMCSWTAMTATGITFLAFGLDYTGRGQMVRNPWFGTLVAIPVVTIGLVWTNPLHGLVWTEFRLDPVFGVATVSYEFGAVAYLNILIGMAFVTAGMLVLFETVISYGPLFRSEALAVALSAIPPGIGLLLWLTQVGPYPQLNLTPIMFLPHVAMDAYAFVGSEMFEFNPATRRTAQRRAFDDLDDPVLVINTDRRVVECNPAAESAFEIAESASLGAPIASVLRSEIETDPSRSNQLFEYRGDGEYAEFSVSVSELSGPSATPVGYVLIFQDVTERRRRKQRLTVTNRVLRHNLRNDINVISGYIDLAKERIDDDVAETHLRRAKIDVENVLEMGEKARTFERTVSALDAPASTVRVRELLSGMGPADDLSGSEPETADLDVRVPSDLELRTNERVFETLFANLVENGFEHTDAEHPRVVVEYEGDTDDAATFRVRDNGSGIPDHELDVIERGDETPLSHGSGLGLWIARWCATAAGGDIEFETGPDGTTVTVRIPTGRGDEESTPIAQSGH